MVIRPNTQLTLFKAHDSTVLSPSVIVFCKLVALDSKKNPTPALSPSASKIKTGKSVLNFLTGKNPLQGWLPLKYLTRSHRETFYFNDKDNK